MLNEHAGVVSRNVLVSLFLVATLSIASGCGEEGSEERATQVAAIVNGEEITIHQINQVLEKSPDINPETVEERKREILDKLIDRELAVQKAVNNKLDRKPKVMQSIEEARNDVLARAYLEAIADNVPKLQDWDMEDQRAINEYYVEHPELFSQRKVFSIEEIVISEGDNLRARLQDLIANGRNINEIAEWLNSRDIKFSARRSVRAAEGISLQHLSRVQAMKPGDIELFELGGGRLQVLRMVNFEMAPIDEATAAPRIAQFLLNVRASEVIAEEMKRLRNTATIQYMGEFSDRESSDAPEATEDSETRAVTE